MGRLPELPDPRDRAAIVGWVSRHLGDLCCDEVAPSSAFRGGQQAADVALNAFDVTGYAARRNEVWPASRRGASRLSPYIRHGLLTLRQVWDHVGGHGWPGSDVAKFRDELLWQEYSRHIYARLGRATASPLRYQPPIAASTAKSSVLGGAERMACLSLVTDELEHDGWLVNQNRMWFASHWTVRNGWDWREGEDCFFTHLLDGSRAANRLGWQWTIGAGTGKAYGFSQWQVHKRAPGLCDGCALRRACPIESWPDVEPPHRVTHEDPRLRADTDPSAAAGPASAQVNGSPDVVWLTAESLGRGDPALTAHPSLPVVFVFDEALLAQLRLSGKRLGFLAECLADLAAERELEVWRGDPVEVLTGSSAAATYAPVPGWRRRAARIDPLALYPWPWLSRPDSGTLSSFSAWRRRHTGPSG